MKGFSELNPEVFTAQGGIVQVGAAHLRELKARASANPRQRARLCAHRGPDDLLHEMLIVLAREVYIRPHKHLGKTESFHVIEGTARVVFFRDDGAIDEVVDLGDAESERCFYFRIDDPRYHTQLITSEHLVFHETTKGPFQRADTVFAPWAPPEDRVVEARAYLRDLAARLNGSRTDP